MKTMTRYLAAATLIVAVTSQAQQSPSPTPQPASPATPAQVKSAPCVPPKPGAPSAQIQIKPTSRWQKLVEKGRAKVEKSTGITLPDAALNDWARQAQAPAPCPPLTPAPVASSIPASTPALNNAKQ